MLLPAILFLLVIILLAAWLIARKRQNTGKILMSIKRSTRFHHSFLLPCDS